MRGTSGGKQKGTGKSWGMASCSGGRRKGNMKWELRRNTRGVREVLVGPIIAREDRAGDDVLGEAPRAAKGSGKGTRRLGEGTWVARALGKATGIKEDGRGRDGHERLGGGGD